MRTIAPVLLLAACATVETEVGFVSPFDGQTDWPPEAALQIHLPEPALPKGQPTPQDLVRVVDLDQGGFVVGELVHDGNDLWFFPDEPFIAGHRFAWQIDVASIQAREPELHIPASIGGEGVFATHPQVDVLDVVHPGSGELCVLFSRTPRASDQILVAVDGVPTDMSEAREVTVPGIEPAAGQGQAERCTIATDFAEGASVRVQVGSRVFQLDAVSDGPEERFAGRYRVTE